MKPEWPDLRPERPDLRPERLDVGSEGPDAGGAGNIRRLPKELKFYFFLVNTCLTKMNPLLKQFFRP